MPRQKRKKQMTIEQLAEIVARGFRGVDERLDGIGKVLATKADKADVSRLEARIERLADMIDTVEEGQILPLQKRVSILEKGFRALSKHMLSK